MNTFTLKIINQLAFIQSQNMIIELNQDLQELH